MKLLLDTHAFIWWANGDARLSLPVREAIDSPEVELWLSAISIWEMAVKTANAKLRRGDALIRKAQDLIDGGITKELPVRAAHAAAARHLPLRHNDPFDRLLICQAVTEGLMLATKDKKIAEYDVPVFW